MSARYLPPELATLIEHMARELRAGLRAAISKGLESLKAREPMTLDEWAEKYFYLSAESSQSEARWQSYPPQRAMLCAMGDDHIEEVDVKKSARVGYTKMLLASIAYDAHHKRRNQCLWQPTDADSAEFCKAELEPMLRDVRAMRTVFPEFMAKSKSNTLNMKKFLGSLLYLKGGTSAGNFRRMTLQSAKLDEFDGFDQKIEKSADPFTLAHKRLEGATYPKMICGSTPRIKGLSHIEKREAAALAVMHYHITCPHCDVEHPLQWGGKDVKHGIKWDAHDPEGTAHHVCPHCHGRITQAQYLGVWQTGVWVSKCGTYRCEGKPYKWTNYKGEALIRPPRHVSFHIWTAYSPQTTWAAIVRQFLDCVAAKKAGDSAPLEGFVNETLGETWEEEVDKSDAHALQKRAEDYPLRTVPVGGMQLCAGVDTQDKRWEVTVWAFGRGEEMWVVDYQVIDGNPAIDAEWESKLWPYLQNTFTHQHGAPMRIAASAVDTGGHYTHQAYNFCRMHAHDKVFAIKGDSQENKPIKGKSSSQDVNYKGKTIKRGVKLWMVGTDTAKDLIFGRLRVDVPGPGYMHFSKYLPTEWFNGLTSEVRRKIRSASGEKFRWVKTAARNEALDTTVYAIFCSHALDHHKLTDGQWKRLENDLLPDLFAPSPAAVAVAQLMAPPGVTTSRSHPPEKSHISSEQDSASPDDSKTIANTAETAVLVPPPIPFTPPKVSGGKISISGLRRASA